MHAFFGKFYETIIEKGYYTMLLGGFRNTMVITFGALVIGVAIGFFIAIFKYFAADSRDWFMRALVGVSDIYITVVRGIPVVVLLLIFYFVIFPMSHGIEVAVLTFGINSGAYMAELVRSGLTAVDAGQYEAGCSLGLNKLQIMRHVIFPQALRNILPGIGNELIALIKETSVAGYVAVVDLTRAGNMVRNNTFDAFNPLLVVALTYLVLVVALTFGLSKFERRLSHGRK